MESECPICNETTTNIVCQYDHAMCDDCMKQYVQTTCSLCRSELLPQFRIMAQKNKIMDEQLNILKAVAEAVFQGLHSFIQAFSITKDSLPEQIVLDLGATQINCADLVKRSIDQITEFSTDPEYSLSKNPWCELVINRGSLQYKKLLFQITV